jgi:hypothetical protein
VMWDNLIIFGSIICVVLLIAIPALDLWEQRRHRCEPQIHLARWCVTVLAHMWRKVVSRG